MGAYGSETCCQSVIWPTETKDVVRLGTGLIGTISALVLGLLIASANSSYDAQSGHIQHLAADSILLDQLLAQYGPEAKLFLVLELNEPFTGSKAVVGRTVTNRAPRRRV